MTGTKSLLPLLLVAALCFSNTRTYSQGVRFCEKAEADGTCIHEGTFFRIPEKSNTEVNVLVKSNLTLSGTTAVLDVFYRTESGMEEFESSVKVPVSADWLWFVQPVRFRRSGDYSVYAYDGLGRLVGAGKVKIEVYR